MLFLCCSCPLKDVMDSPDVIFDNIHGYIGSTGICMPANTVEILHPGHRLSLGCRQMFNIQYRKYHTFLKHFEYFFVLFCEFFLNLCSYSDIWYLLLILYAFLCSVVSHLSDLSSCWIFDSTRTYCICCLRFITEMISINLYLFWTS